MANFLNTAWDQYRRGYQQKYGQAPQAQAQYVEPIDYTVGSTAVTPAAEPIADQQAYQPFSWLPIPSAPIGATQTNQTPYVGAPRGAGKHAPASPEPTPAAPIYSVPGPGWDWHNRSFQTTPRQPAGTIDYQPQSEASVPMRPATGLPNVPSGYSVDPSGREPYIDPMAAPGRGYAPIYSRGVDISNLVSAGGEGPYVGQPLGATDVTDPADLRASDTAALAASGEGRANLASYKAPNMLSMGPQTGQGQGGGEQQQSGGLSDAIKQIVQHLYGGGGGGTGIAGISSVGANVGSGGSGSYTPVTFGGGGGGAGGGAGGAAMGISSALSQFADAFKKTHAPIAVNVTPGPLPSAVNFMPPSLSPNTGGGFYG